MNAVWTPWLILFAVGVFVIVVGIAVVVYSCIVVGAQQNEKMERGE